MQFQCMQANPAPFSCYCVLLPYFEVENCAIRLVVLMMSVYLSIFFLCSSLVY